MNDPLNLALNEKFLLDNLLNGVCLIDGTKRIVYWNAAAEQFLGYSPADVAGKACDDETFIRGSDGDVLCCSYCPLACRERGESRESRKSREKFVPPTVTADLRHKDGYRLPALIRCVPLMDGNDKLTGAIKIFEPARLSEDLDVKLKELGQFAYIDALTSIPNRRYMDEILQEWLQPNNRRGFPYAVVMGDIDFFKKINDEHGHDMGDVVLKKVAGTLRKNLRATDTVARWGGEEFLILLHSISASQLRKKLESLRKAVEACKFESKGPSINVTMSFGASLPRQGDTAASIVGRADGCLYKSKNEGRNRVSVADDIVE